MDLRRRLFAHGLALGDRAQHRLYGERKGRLFADLEGTVVEIGPGTGVNVPYLPAGGRWIGIEPNPHMHGYLRDKLRGRDLDATLRTAPARDTGLPPASADAVVSTLVLCSVPDLDAALSELRRILRPGGRLVFIEHVAAPDGSWLRWLQGAIRPAWKCVADGCRPDRETASAIERAGFEFVEIERFDTGLPVVAPHIMGVAIRGGD
jgi:SAM-dependent methyltransferase